MITIDEALTLIRIAAFADDGCYYCVSAQMRLLIEAFPLVDWKQVQALTTDRENAGRLGEAIEKVSVRT